MSPSCACAPSFLVIMITRHEELPRISWVYGGSTIHSRFVDAAHATMSIALTCKESWPLSCWFHERVPPLQADNQQGYTDGQRQDKTTPLMIKKNIKWSKWIRIDNRKVVNIYLDFTINGVDCKAIMGADIIMTHKLLVVWKPYMHIKGTTCSLSRDYTLAARTW